jgi:hypothetical protein
MGTKLFPPDNELYQRIDEVLHYLWDPVGVSRLPMARDEYRGYLPKLFSLLSDGVTEEQLADYLGRAVTERMGLPPRRARDLEIARLLVRWRDTIQRKRPASRPG